LVVTYPDKSSSSDGVFDVEVSGDELSLIIRFHVLLIFGKGLKASAASVVMIILLSRDNIDTLIVVFEARLLSLGLGLRVGELSMCCRVIVEDIIS
jgi:hypothetical protein